MSRLTRFSFTALALMTVMGGCADERPPRSFVQPNVLKKTDLDGTWYYLATVSDAPPTSSVMFVGQYSELEKIKFDIQENYLYARRSYEQVVGSEDQASSNPSGYLGQPLAVWRIEKQFDIIRDYNPTTGEESNKIIESEERGWNEREFMRVDWSQNQVYDIQGLGMWMMDDNFSVQPVSYWESDPTKPDALHLERADTTDPDFKAGEANYFDLTNKMVITPLEQTLCYEENSVTQCFTVPACYLYYSVQDCASQVVKVRHAFTKISPQHQFQPREWDGLQMQQFGIFDNRRFSYNRQYGITNSGFIRRAQRFNLWEKSYGADGKTPLPFDQRNLRTIPYYAMSTLEPFPPELFDSGKEVIRQWNEAMKVAVQDVTGKPAPHDVFVWCHNPVKLADDSMGPKDDDACKANIKPELDAKGNIIKDGNGNPIFHARYGDPRRSNIMWVNEEQNAGPLGLGPGLSDPETGETMAGYANIYGAALDTYAARSRDLVLLVAGKLDPNAYVAGLNVQDWVSANKAGVPNMPTLSKSDVGKMAAAMDFRWARGQAPEAKIDGTNTQTLLTSLQNRENAIYRGGLFGTSNADLSQVNRDRLKGGILEAMMVTPDLMAMGGTSPGTDWTSLSPDEKSRVSPLRSNAVRQAIAARMDKLRSFGYDYADFADEGLAQRAIALANDPNIPNMDPEAIRQKLRKDIFLAVTLHEVGHNMGLRHNFRASFDSMNYFPNYWMLRSAGLNDTMKFGGMDTTTGQPIAVPFNATNDPAVKADCDKNKGQLRARYVDCPGGAVSLSEFNGGVREWQYSSIMDYGAEFNSDLMGLGHYDKASIKFSYAGDGFVEVFTDAKVDNASLDRISAVQGFRDAYGFPSPLTNDAFGLASINYTTYPGLFKSGSGGIEMRKDVPVSSITLQSSGNGSSYSGDGDGNPQVPYFFCSDEFVGNLTCQRFDSGADAFEQASDIISRYNNFYVLNNFKRDRATFHSSLAYIDRISERYLETLREQLTWLVLLRSDFEDFLSVNNVLQPGMETKTPEQAVNDFMADDINGWGTFTAGVNAGFELMGQIIARPQAGQFAQIPDTSTTDYPVTYWKQWSDTTQVQAIPGVANIGLIDGKFSETTWDFNGCGYYWADECQTRIGYFLDKTIALQVLAESQAYFTGRDTSTDVRKYAIGYILPYKAQVQEKLGALLAGDLASYAPRFKDLDSKKVVLPSWSLNAPGTDSSAQANLIDPQTGFTLQLYAGMYGLSSFPTTFDHSFIDTTRIFVVGNGEAPVPDSQLVNADGTVNTANATDDPTKLITQVANGKQWFVWKDAVSQKTYAAQASAKTGNGGVGASYRNDTAVRMLETALSMDKASATATAAATAACNTDPTSQDCNAKQQVAQAKSLATGNFHQNIDVMRSLHNAFGYATYKSDAPFYY